jgi:hypothetical protein
LTFISGGGARTTPGYHGGARALAGAC